MIFVIMVAGYKHLPFLYPQVGSVPVSTFKHAGEDDGPSEWANWEKSHPGTHYRLGIVTEATTDNLYSVALETEVPETPEVFVNVPIQSSRILKPGDEIVAIEANNVRRFQQRGIGCTFTDWVAPFFVFIVGLCIPLSRLSRESGWWKHVGMRTLGLIGLGVIYMSLILKLSWWWGILQAIGIAYLMAALFLRLPPWKRWLAFIGVVIFHTWMSFKFPWWQVLGNPDKGFWTIVTPDGDMLKPLMVHCTPWVSISYGLCAVAGSFLGEAVLTREAQKIMKTAFGLGILFLIAGYLLHLFVVPINKDNVSASYSIFTSGIACLVFLLFYWLIDVKGWKKGWSWFLAVFGSNALFAYFMQPFVRFILKAFGVYDGLGGLSGWQGVLGGLEWTIVIWLVVLYFNRRGVYWKL
jgi:predicted acyltransferase